ncbi:hypothetical protein [Mucilaginibacter antarcticus]|uniref:DUF5017 domain-containing protein n=1 Tax=Mucilaginibacter antarcticus TaxID=1855725 RepID=A0ABW5XUK8_9SPHI
MKKIFHLLAVAAVALSLTGCDPMDKTYKELGDLPKPALSVNLTLTAADYALLPTTDYAKTGLYYKTLEDAKVSIPAILAKKYTNYNEKSAITVTYGAPPLTVKPIDTVFASIAYTLLPADYTLNGGTTTSTNFSATTIITWLGIKYPTATEGKLAVITFNFFDQGATTTAVQQSFLFTGGAWTKLYHITPAQYTSLGKGGNNNNFVTADAAIIPSYLNTLLKADPSVSVTAKAGDVKYVSYKYFQAATGTAPTQVPAVTAQRVIGLTFDGTNWTTKPAAASPLIFVKTNGVWVPDNTVNYQLTPADHVTISGLTFGSDAARANLASFKSVDLRSSSPTKWLPEEIADAVKAFAKIKFGATAEQNQVFNLSYYGYTGSYAYVLVKLKYVGTEFTFVK